MGFFSAELSIRFGSSLPRKDVLVSKLEGKFGTGVNATQAAERTYLERMKFVQSAAVYAGRNDDMAVIIAPEEDVSIKIFIVSLRETNLTNFSADQKIIIRLIDEWIKKVQRFSKSVGSSVVHVGVVVSCAESEILSGEVKSFGSRLIDSARKDAVARLPGPVGSILVAPLFSLPVAMGIAIVFSSILTVALNSLVSVARESKLKLEGATNG